MKSFKDQMNRTIRLEHSPRRIVSLVPSQTELLYDLGLDEEVVGITKFCVHPEEWFRTKDRVGGTKQVHIEKVRELKPDLIIGNKEENTREDICELEKIAPVWMSDIITVEDALNMISEIGAIVGRDEESNRLCNLIRKGFNELRQMNIGGSFHYYIWKSPDFLAGKQTFISNMLEELGLQNLCLEERYPEFKDDQAKPDFVFLSTEPYPFKDADIEEFKKRYPDSDVRLIDGEMVSWYGSRMERSIDYFKSYFTS